MLLMDTLEIRVGKTILKIYELGLFFVLVFLAFLYFFLAREMCFVPISFFTILHFPWPQVARGGKCKIVKNEIGTKHISRARKKYKNAKNTKTKNNPRGKQNIFPTRNTEFCKGNIQHLDTRCQLTTKYVKTKCCQTGGTCGFRVRAVSSFWRECCEQYQLLVRC